MAAPTIVSVTKTLVSTLTSNPTINLDASVQEGDLVYIAMCFGRNRPIGATWPAGWTELFDVNNTTGNQMEQSHAWRIMPSSPSTTVQVTSAGTVAMVAWAFRITGYDAATAPASATAINTGDPPNLDPPWGNEETLYGSMLSRSASWTTPTWPFPNNQQNDALFGSGVGICTGVVTADSQNPAAWVSITDGVASIFAIRGATATEHQATLTAGFGFSAATTATVEHPATLTGSFGFTATATATVEHHASPAASFGFTAGIEAIRETAAVLDAHLGFASTATATVEDPATLVAALGFVAAVTAAVEHPAVLAGDFGFAAHIDATTGTPVEAALAADLGFTASVAATVSHPAALNAAFGFTAAAAAAVTHHAALVATLGFVAHIAATGGTASDPIVATFTEPTGAVFREPATRMFQEAP